MVHETRTETAVLHQRQAEAMPRTILRGFVRLVGFIGIIVVAAIACSIVGYLMPDRWFQWSVFLTGITGSDFAQFTADHTHYARDFVNCVMAGSFLGIAVAIAVALLYALGRKDDN